MNIIEPGIHDAVVAEVGWGTSCNGNKYLAITYSTDAGDIKDWCYMTPRGMEYAGRKVAAFRVAPQKVSEWKRLAKKPSPLLGRQCRIRVDRKDGRAKVGFVHPFSWKSKKERGAP